MNQRSGHDSDGGAGRLRVCRFWTRSLGNLPSMRNDNFGVELVVRRHSLFDLIRAVRRFGGSKLYFREMPEDLPDDEYAYGHAALDGWEYRPFRPSDPVPLDFLELHRGQRGEYVNDWPYCGSFTFEVDDPSFVCHDAATAFPLKVVAPERHLTAQCDSSHLTQDERERAQQLRYGYEDYYEFLYRHGGLNGYCHGTRDVKYQAPMWGHEDEILIIWFINAGRKPKKTWESCLKYTCVNRTESAFSQRWQKCRQVQEAWGDRCDDVVLAKRCSINVMHRHFYEGGPSFLDRDDQKAFEDFQNSRYYYLETTPR